MRIVNLSFSAVRAWLHNIRTYIEMRNIMRVISVVWSSFVLIIVQVIWAKKRNFVAKGNCDKNGLSGADIKYLNL